jgi:hypothetical protein
MFGGGRSGPPVMPVLPPIKDKDEFGRPLRRPRPGLDSHTHWAWLAAAAFATLALALKLLLWRGYNPSALFSALAALLIAAPLWGWAMSGRAAVTSTRGALLGSLVGLLVPLAAWGLFALYLLLVDSESLKAISWIFAFAAATLAPEWAVAVPSAALLGAVLGYIEHGRLEAEAGRGVHS